MALSALTVWEVRTAGSDTLCGGGFVAGASGTDYSQQNAAQYTGTDLVIDAATNTKVTSATHNFVAADVGNIMQITAGTGFTTGFFQIVSVAANAATLDRSAGTLSSTGGTFAVGGALATPGKATGASVTGNDIWIKSGTYTISSGTADVANGRLNNKGGTIGNAGKIRGYNTARWTTVPTTTDLANKPLLQASGITNVVICDSTAGNFGSYECIEADGASLTTMTGFGNSGGGTIRFQWCKASNCPGNGFGLSTNAQAFEIETTACGAGGLRAAISAAGCAVVGFYCHADAGFSLLSTGTACFFDRGIVSGCLDASVGGIRVNIQKTVIQNVTVYGGAESGIDLNAGNCVVRNVVSYGNATYGFKAGSSDDSSLFQNCAGGSNTSGSANANVPNFANYVALTGNPFTSAGTGDFSLNNTAGAGAACRAAGIPGAFPGGLTTGYLDIGAAQHADAGGSTGAASSFFNNQSSRRASTY